MNARLLALEKTGDYVFHGSPSSDLKVLEPKQGKHVPDLSKPFETILDDKPAVSATPYLELAVFRAIVNRVNAPFDFGSSFGVRDGKLEYRVSSEEVLESVSGKKGYVYVFKKSDFEPYSRDDKNPTTEKSMEWRSYKSIQPIEVIEVSSDDLPDRRRIEIHS